MQCEHKIYLNVGNPQSSDARLCLQRVKYGLFERHLILANRLSDLIVSCSFNVMLRKREYT